MNNNEPAHCYTDLIRLRAELGKGYTASKFDFARIIEVFWNIMVLNFTYLKMGS